MLTGLIPAPNDNIPGDISDASFKALSPQLHIKTALQFISQHASNTTHKFLRDFIMQKHPGANLSVGNAKALYSIGKTSFVNMRFTFKKAIIRLAQAYISNNER